MLNLDTFNTADLVELSQRVSFAIDMSSNEENYTILDEIENILALREIPDPVQYKQNDLGDHIPYEDFE